MDLRTFRVGMDGAERVTERMKRISKELGLDLSPLMADPKKIGDAEEKNCENMFGHVGIPIGLAGPLRWTLSTGEQRGTYLPLATTEGALVASINRGCKALTEAGTIRTRCIYHGTTRSLAFRALDGGTDVARELKDREPEWRAVGEGTSGHLKILRADIDEREGHVFLTIACDTDEAMGMNMVTIAAAEIGNWVAENLPVEFVTVAANVDGDKKPSKRTHDLGRGHEVIAEGILPRATVENILKTTPEQMVKVARAKLAVGSQIAGSIGKNLHIANVIAALYLATGQDAAHVVEGSLGDTTVMPEKDGLRVMVRLPALLVGVRGGGTQLPAQNTALKIILKEEPSLHPRQLLAETIGAAVLAGEMSLLAAQAAHDLAMAHVKLAR
ncbi:3-hydroxy-3-methylglutaryl-CoA reductase [Candidatus Peregrinibacteria bacterium]|nr:3-hydroxy-3-methylglutaryl-CoA reductase [Candidatus Peregrinibacteria bacterium]